LLGVTAFLSALVCAGVVAGVSFAGAGDATTARTKAVEVVKAVDVMEIGGDEVNVPPGEDKVPWLSAPRRIP
jgi:hypothetical protein